MVIPITPLGTTVPLEADVQNASQLFAPVTLVAETCVHLIKEQSAWFTIHFPKEGSWGDGSHKPWMGDQQLENIQNGWLPASFYGWEDVNVGREIEGIYLPSVSDPKGEKSV